MGGIVDIQVARVQTLLADRKVTLDLTGAERAWLGRDGYDPVYGARPLKRAVQKYVQDPLADLILKIGRAHVCTHVHTAHLASRLLLSQKKHNYTESHKL